MTITQILAWSNPNFDHGKYQSGISRCPNQSGFNRFQFNRDDWPPVRDQSRMTRRLKLEEISEITKGYIGDYHLDNVNQGFRITIRCYNLNVSGYLGNHHDKKTDFQDILSERILPLTHTPHFSFCLFDMVMSKVPNFNKQNSCIPHETRSVVMFAYQKVFTGTR